MKILIIVFVLIESFTASAQKNVAGDYQDYFGNSIQLNLDSTFEYTWHFDMSVSWTKGVWIMKGDTVYFYMTPVYDTITQTSMNGNTLDTLILSIDETPDRVVKHDFDPAVLSSGGQNIMGYPKRLLFRKGRLYKIQKGKLVFKKRRPFWSGRKEKKRVPWFFKIG